MQFKSEWDLSPLFAGDDAPEIQSEIEEVARRVEEFEKKWKERNDYLKKPEVLEEALSEYEHLVRDFGTGGNSDYYFWLRSQQDQNNPKIKARLSQISELSSKLSVKIQFFTHRIAAIPENKQKTFLEYPPLNKYKHFLEGLFQEAKYLLSEEEEKIITLKATTSFSKWVQMTSSFLAKEEAVLKDETGQTKPRSFSEVLELINNRDKQIRDTAVDTLNNIFHKHIEVGENEMNAILYDKKIDDELRKVPRPDKIRHFADDIDTEVVDTMLETVAGRFDLSKRYYELKAKLLKLEKLEYHERNIEYGEVDKKYTYEESVELLRQTLKSLDPVFLDIYNQFLEKGRIDVFPRKNKTSGAFCAQGLLTQPTYILLNFTGRLNDVLTQAHELGHAVNDELMRQKQNALNFGSPLSTAEVASTFLEDFVLEKILENANDEQRLSLQMTKLNSDISAIQRQVAAYKFEMNLHKSFRENGYLPKEEIGKIFTTHMESYMGEAVIQSPGSQNWWLYWSHLRHFFYVYSYAFGLLISKSLQNFVKHDPNFVEKVKGLLSAGTSAAPKDIFLGLGIDIADRNFWNKGLDEQEELLNQTWTLAQKLGKI